MERIGFIGVGSIGSAMARCVIRGGFKVTICDKSLRALEEFKKIAPGAMPPVMIIVCNNTSVSKMIYNYVSGYEIEEVSNPFFGREFS